MKAMVYILAVAFVTCHCPFVLTAHAHRGSNPKDAELIVRAKNEISLAIAKYEACTRIIEESNSIRVSTNDINLNTEKELKEFKVTTCKQNDMIFSEQTAAGNSKIREISCTNKSYSFTVKSNDKDIFTLISYKPVEESIHAGSDIHTYAYSELGNCLKALQEKEGFTLKSIIIEPATGAVTVEFLNSVLYKKTTVNNVHMLTMDSTDNWKIISSYLTSKDAPSVRREMKYGHRIDTLSFPIRVSENVINPKKPNVEMKVSIELEVRLSDRPVRISI
jgi:hypothetical protein